MNSLTAREIQSIVWLTAKILVAVALMGSGVSSFIYQNF